jgi:2-methylcitrate dehydratase PrpD
MRSCRIKIETKDGGEFETFVGYPRGSPQNPLSEEELVGKFRKLATRAVGDERTKDLVKCLDKLENLSNIDKLVEKVSLF